MSNGFSEFSPILRSQYDKKTSLQFITSLLNFTLEKFNKRCVSLSTELQEMKYEIHNSINYIINYITKDNQEKSRPKSDKKIKMSDSSVTVSSQTLPSKKGLQNSPTKEKIKKIFNQQKNGVSFKSGLITKKPNIKKTYSSLSEKKINKQRTVIKVGKKKKSFQSNSATINVNNTTVDCFGLDNNKDKSLFITFCSGFLTLEDKIKMSFLNKELRNKILNDGEFLIKKDFEKIKVKISCLEKEKQSSKIDFEKVCTVKDEGDNSEINILCYPSKTAQMGVQFLTAEKEKTLLKDTNLYTLLSILTTSKDASSTPSNFPTLDFDSIYKQNGVSSLKNLFTQRIFPRVYQSNNNENSKITFSYNNEQMSKSISLIEEMEKSSKSQGVFDCIKYCLEEIKEIFKLYLNNENTVKLIEGEKKRKFLLSELKRFHKIIK